MDTFWVLLCAALVFLMQSGFLCLESGLTRSKNAINVAMKNMTDFAVSVLLFWAFGFALMFGNSWMGWIGSSHFLLPLDHQSSALSTMFLFQAMFCATAATIVSGAVAGRMRFAVYVVTTVIVSGLVYPVFGHWAWGGAYEGPPGWLAARGFVDFAGSSVVHSVGGWAALATILVLGPRTGRFEKESAPKEIPGSNLPMAMLGTMLLWMGWVGFNGGSTLAMNQQVAGIIGNTFLAGAAGMLTALAVGWWVVGHANVNLAINGSLAGLVAITASCHAVTAPSAITIGSVGAIVMMGVQQVMSRHHIDDAVGAVSVHAGAGLWGTLAVAVFGAPDVLGTGLSRWVQLQVQLLGVSVAFTVTFGTTYVLLRLISQAFALRVTPEQEQVGLNVSEHGASTELYELLGEMEWQRRAGDFSRRVTVEPGSDVGQIAAQYNRVLDKVTQETTKAMRTAEMAEQSRRQAEKISAQLQDSETRLRTIMETANEGIVTINARGVVESFNKAAAEMFGYRAEEVLGNNVSMLMASPEAEQHDEYIAEYLRTGKNKVIGIRREVEGRRKDGTSFPMELAVSEVNLDGTCLFTAIIRDLTEHKRTEEALRKNHEYVNNIIGSMINTLIVVAPDGTIATVNEATCKLLGYREEELIGQPASLLFSEEADEGAEEELANMVVSRKALPMKGAMLRTLTSTGYASDVEGHYVAKDGRKIPVSFSGSVMRGSDGEIMGIVCVAQDITEQRKAKAKILESESRYRTIFEGSSDAIMLLDEGGFIDCNAATLTVFGLSDKSDFISRHPAEFSPPTQPDGVDSVSKSEEKIATAFREGFVKFEWLHRRANGEDFPAEVWLTASSLGERRIIQATVRDISMQKQLQCELAQAQKLESVGQLAAGIAHEINTPTQYVGDNTRFLKDAFGDLCTVLDKFDKLLQAAKDGNVDDQLVAEVEAAHKQVDIDYLTEEIPQAIDQSLDGVERVAKIVRAMKEFSHPGTEQKSPINLAEAIETTITVAHNEWKYVAEMVTEFDPELPDVSCLPGELNQVFLNLIVNAAHAIADTLDDDGAEKGTITVSTRRDGAWAEIQIRDTGTGIPESIRARIFDPFFTTKEVGKGTGQGLAIARSVVVDKHGGTIDCVTEQGKGTTFVVRLPIDGGRLTRGANEDEDARSIR